MHEFYWSLEIIILYWYAQMLAYTWQYHHSAQ